MSGDGAPTVIVEPGSGAGLRVCTPGRIRYLCGIPTRKSPPRMSSTLQTSLPPPERRLAALRAELDQIDDALHDLLMRRAEVVGQVATLGVKGRVPMRPGREASIIRRLLGRHAGRLPPVGIVRIWRELICAHTALQRPLLVAVCAGGEHEDGNAAGLAAAREHFGSLTPLRALPGPEAALRDVAAGAAGAAVLPLPSEDDPAARWWTALVDDPSLHVVARLPFWAARPEGSPAVRALVVTAAPPDPSGQDRSLLAFAPAVDVGAAAALAGAGFESGPPLLARRNGGLLALADVAGFVADDDPRLAALPAGARVVGAYAVPIAVPVGVP